MHTSTLQIDGKKIQYSLSGEGKPSIVFLSGHRTPLSNWDKLIPPASKIGTVLAYDRLDTGGSGKSTSPQDGDAILATLNSILDELKIIPPYVLVAHSLGGLYTNLYARRYPEKVAAIVFVEAGHPTEATDMAAKHEPKTGFFAKLLPMLTPAFKKDPNSEFNNVVATVKQIEGAPDFPNISVAVITGGMKMPFVPEDAYSSHLKWQQALATISPSGYQVMAEKSGHTPQVSEAELVMREIEKAVILV